MSTIEQILLAVLALGGLAAVGGGAALLRLLQRNAPPPVQRHRSPPVPTVEEAAAARTEEKRTAEALDRHAATRDEIAAVQAIPDADARTKALADLVRRRRGGR